MDNFNFTVVKWTTAYFEWIKGSSWRSARWSVKGTRATVVYCKRNLNSFSDIVLVVFQFSSKDCKRALVWSAYVFWHHFRITGLVFMLQMCLLFFKVGHIEDVAAALIYIHVRLQCISKAGWLGRTLAIAPLAFWMVSTELMLAKGFPSNVTRVSKEPRLRAKGHLSGKLSDGSHPMIFHLVELIPNWWSRWRALWVKSTLDKSCVSQSVNLILLNFLIFNALQKFLQSWQFYWCTTGCHAAGFSFVGWFFWKSNLVAGGMEGEEEKQALDHTSLTIPSLEFQRVRSTILRDNSSSWYGIPTSGRESHLLKWCWLRLGLPYHVYII